MSDLFYDYNISFTDDSQGLRECCRAIRIGKILIDTDNTTGAANVLYSRLWNDIDKRRVMLLYPIMS